MFLKIQLELLWENIKSIVALAGTHDSLIYISGFVATGGSSFLISLMLFFSIILYKMYNGNQNDTKIELEAEEMKKEVIKLHYSQKPHEHKLLDMASH